MFVAGLAPAAISYQASAGGNFYDGVSYWTGSGSDTVTINSTEPSLDSSHRTPTELNSGLGNNNVTVKLQSANDGFFVLNGAGGSATGTLAYPFTHSMPTGATNNNTIDASASTLPLIIFGGFGNNTIKGGQGGDIIFGTLGRVQYADTPAHTTMLAQYGYGGRGDMFSDQVLEPVDIYSFAPDYATGGNNTIYGGSGADVIVGGHGNNAIDGGNGNDLIVAVSAMLDRRARLDSNFTNPRYQALSGTAIYDGNGVDLVSNVPQNNPDGPAWWGNFTLTLPDHFNNTPSTDFGNNYLVGGGGNDTIFGGLGSDVIQGDGSIARDLAQSFAALPCVNPLLTVGSAGWHFANLVGACRDASRFLWVNASSSAGPDTDYIEGGGGISPTTTDTIFGGLGQKDIVGGSSDLFGLTTPQQRPDGVTMIFGGTGTLISRENCGDGYLNVNNQCITNSNGHETSADVILSNNGDIFRLVGTNGSSTGGYLQFNYDNYSTTGAHIVPRAVRRLDYTPGGPDLNGGEAGPLVSAAHALNHFGDIGGPFEVHAEGGDAWIYGGPNAGVIYGGGQNDTIITGYGNDWVSGGRGQSCIIAGDGQCYASREQVAEPLYGIAATPLQSLIANPGNHLTALINVNAALNYTALIYPVPPAVNAPPGPMFRTKYYNDIVYGGWGDDAIHTTFGSDAVSGAEAPTYAFTNNYDMNGNQVGLPVESDWYHPYNPGNVLGFNPTTGKFALFDQNDRRREVVIDKTTGGLCKAVPGGNCVPWILSYDPGDMALLPVSSKWTFGTAYSPESTSGDDAIFGDFGNSWILGGQGRSRLYGGWGNSILDLRARLDVDGGLNDMPVTDPTQSAVGTPAWEGLAYGGSGQDILFAGTGGDRLIDWTGNHSTFVVPFAPYGEPTITRGLAPGDQVYLYGLSKSDGADQTLGARFGGTAARNGEPFGELGVVIHGDAAWNAQHGPPFNPMPGNLGGVQRDIHGFAANGPIQSPGTDPPAPSLVPAVAAPSVVGNSTQTSVPVVVSGQPGTNVTLTVTDGTTTVTTTGTVDPFGQLTLALNLSVLANTTLTASIGGSATTTFVKSAGAPGAAIIFAPAYINIANQRYITFNLSGPAGVFVQLELSDGIYTEVLGDVLDPATGTLSLTFNLLNLAEGPLTATATTIDNSGNMTTSSVTVIKDITAPRQPSLSLPKYVNQTNRTGVPIAVTGEVGATATVSVTDGTTVVTGSGVVAANGSVAIGLNLSALKDGTLTLSGYLTDPAGNQGAGGVAATSLKDTIAPAGSFTINGGATVINGQQATGNPAVVVQLGFSDVVGLLAMAFSTDGGATYGSSYAYGTSVNLTLPAADGVYTIAVAVLDVAGNRSVVTKTIRLDRTPPVITAALPAPTNGAYYDVGKKITLTYGATDVDNATTTVVIDGKVTVIGGVIDIDTLTTGTHTIVITATDGVGNTSTKTLTFTIHATINGLINAVNDGASRGLITASEQSLLVWYLQKALQGSAKVRLGQFTWEANNQSGKAINAAEAALLLNWGNDLIARTP
jgi:Ca2+-binding RTX toxin-like protein